MKDDTKEISVEDQKAEDQEKMLFQLYRSYDGEKQGFLDTIKENASNYMALKEARDTLMLKTQNDSLIDEINTEMANLEGELLQLTQSSPINLSAAQQYEALSRLDTAQEPWDISNHSSYDDLSDSPYSFNEKYKKVSSELSEMRLKAIRPPLVPTIFTAPLAILVLVITAFTAGIGTAAIAAGLVFAAGFASAFILDKRNEKSAAKKQEELQSLEKKIDASLIHMTEDHDMKGHDMTQDQDITQGHNHTQKIEFGKETSLRRSFHHRTSKLLDTHKNHTEKVLAILERVKAKTGQQTPSEKEIPKPKR